MRVTLIPVVAVDERNGPNLLADAEHGRGPVYAGADEMDVVNAGAVVDRDRVRAWIKVRDKLAVRVSERYVVSVVGSHNSNELRGRGLGKIPAARRRHGDSEEDREPHQPGEETRDPQGAPHRRAFPTTISPSWPLTASANMWFTKL